MERFTFFVPILLTICAVCEVRNQHAVDKGVHWAVIVAGSNGWYNYRHQADACHAYQIMKRNGIPEERIITMMMDDIAHDAENPTPGVIINHPNGTDVYGGVKIDYRQEDVTPENFLAVLRGDGQALDGVGTGKVLKSGPNDHVFVNFADHGAPGIIAFPDSELHASELMKAINYMWENKMYKQMVFYIEACESGSMFDGLLPSNISVYATTAANGKESSYACYYDPERRTYLGDVYSVMWMEDTDKEDISKETLHQQFKIVREETNTSHVQQYGDRTIAKQHVDEFQGGVHHKMMPDPIVLPKAPLNAVRSEDVPLAVLFERLSTPGLSRNERDEIMQEIQEIQKDRSRIEGHFENIARVSTDSDEQFDRVRFDRSDLKNWDCYERVARDYDKYCVDLSKNDYAMRQLYVLVNLCEEGISRALIRGAIQETCITSK